MPNWTPTEDRELRRMAAEFKAAEIAKALGRTPAATRQRAYKLKVRLEKDGERRHLAKYSDAVVERCRELHDAGKGPAAIARETGVPVGSVKAFVYYRQRTAAPVGCCRVPSAHRGASLQLEPPG